MSCKFDEAELKRYVLEKLKLKEEKLAKIVLALTRLRSIIHATQRQKRAKNWNEFDIQCMMQLFLKYMFKRVKSLLVAGDARNVRIELSLGDKKWKGHSDLKCGRDVLVEMNSSTGPKQQVLGQAMGWRQAAKKESEEVVPCTLAYLTDIFAVSVLLLDDTTALLSQRVTGAEAVCLRLLLMCCFPTGADWSKLLPGQDRSDIKVGDLQDVVDDVEDVADQEEIGKQPNKEDLRRPSSTSKKQERNSGGKNSKRPVHNDKENVCGNAGNAGNAAWGCFGENDEEREERLLDDVLRLRRWDANCRGVGEAYLGQERFPLQRPTEPVVMGNFDRSKDKTLNVLW